MSASICKAIAEKKVIEFFYDGGSRVVEPHCHGITRAGNPAVRGFQTSGHSLSGGVPDWRLFEITKISNLKTLEQTFATPRSGYKQGDKGMASICCEL